MIGQFLSGLLAMFSTSAVGSPKKPCPAAKPQVRYVDDGGVPTVHSATVKSTLEVSNIRTSLQLPPGFLDVSTDRDNFKIEVVDTTVKGNKIPAPKVTLEALTPKGKPFNPPRKMNVELQRVPGTDLFRSRYLRLVVDEVDKATNNPQTLLTDWDPKNHKTEILAQIIRVKYEGKNCPVVQYDATVGNTNRMSIRMFVHILRTAPKGGGIVTVANAKQQVAKWMRRLYAQVSLAPKLLDAHLVDPPENLIAISNYTGANATGGTPITFTIRGGTVKKKQKPKLQVIGPYTPKLGDTPIATANQLAALIRKETKFQVRVVQNPPVLDPAITQGSADLIITDPRGGRVTISALVAADPTQTVTVGRVNSQQFRGWALPDAAGTTQLDWVVGSIMQRTVLQNYDTGANRIDLVVVGAHAVSGNRGEAMLFGSWYAAGRQAIPQITMSAFVIQAAMNGTDADPFVTPHEVGHDLLDAIHANLNTQMMHHAVPTANTDGATKRIHEVAEGFNDPALSFVQETRMRANGASVLTPFVP